VTHKPSLSPTDDRGINVTVLEPVAEMKAKLAEIVPRAKLLDGGTAEAIPLPDASVDVVTVAQAFHWFATPKAVAEMARVLKPGGMWRSFFATWTWPGTDGLCRSLGADLECS